LGLVCLERFYDVNSAEIARGAVASADVPAFVFDRAFLNLAWFMTTALGGVRLMVPNDRIADAADALAYSRARTVADEGIDICPVCGSRDVSRLYSGWSLAGTLALLGLTGTALPVALWREGRHCRACDRVWKASHDI